MTPQGNETSTTNNIWLRGVFMILFGILYNLAGTVLKNLQYRGKAISFLRLANVTATSNQAPS